LLYCPGLLNLSFQVLILRLLADYPDGNLALLRVVNEIGGVKEVFLRFFQHYTVSCCIQVVANIYIDSLSGIVSFRDTEHSLLMLQAFSPFTLWELGFNFNHTKPLMRLFRNRGVLAAMSTDKKLELAIWLLNCSHGDLTSISHYLGRADMHKLAKEAFLCLAESCTRDELDQARPLLSIQLSEPHVVVQLYTDHHEMGRTFLRPTCLARLDLHSGSHLRETLSEHLCSSHGTP